MKPCSALVIGGSAGSLEVLIKVLPQIRTDINFAIIIVLHRKTGSESLLSNLLSAKTTLKVKEVDEKEKILPQTVYIAPAEYHLLIEKNLTFSLDYSEKINFSRPAIDVTFQSAAETFGSSLVCLLLSGSNADGVKGLNTVSEHKGIILVQDPESAQVKYMPLQAILNNKVTQILTVDKIAAYINSLT